MTASRLIAMASMYLLVNMAWAAVPDSINHRVKTVGINLGYYNMGSIDELYSYANYSGANLAYCIKFYDEKKSRNHQLSLRAAMINRTPKSLNINKNYFDDNSSIVEKNSFLFESFDTYRFYLEKASPTFLKLYATGTWLTSVNITMNEYGLPEMIQSGISVGLFAEKKFEKLQLYLGFSIPVFMWTVRNSYSLSLTQTYENLNELTFIRQNSQLQFPNSLRAIYSNVGCTYALSKRIFFESEYEFRAMLNTSPRPLRSVAGIYSFGLIYKF